MRTRAVSAFIVLAFALLASASPAAAQMGLRGIESSPYIEVSPKNPAPGDTVHLTVHSGAINLPESTLTWLVNGKQIASGLGSVTTDIVAPSFGTASSVVVTIESEGTSATAATTIAPARLSLLFEADSYIPPFFEGRALPSAGTRVRLQAIPYFQQSDGALVPTSQITFTWKRNGQTILSASGRGRNTALFPSPELFGVDSISVDASSDDSTFTGSASVTLPSIEPILLLYEDHPLFGVMYHHALSPQSFIAENEMTFMALPLFAPARSPDDPRLIYTWRVNGNDIVADPLRRSEITVDASKAPGPALLDLEVIHATNLFMEAKGSWSVTFSSTQSGPSQNPFTRAQ